jgi:hypothetical protein
MKEGPFITRFVFSPWLLSVVPAIIIFLLLPPLDLKYRLTVEKTGKEYATDMYVDLNSDGITEVVRSGKGLPFYHLLIMDNNLRVFDQWNFRDDLLPDPGALFVGNIDNDLYLEIFAFTYKGDSLFLNVNEFFEPCGIKAERIYITKISIVNNSVTSMVYPAGFYDVNNDGISEFYFTIQTGFGLEPRQCYFFDVVNKKLKSSKFTGIMFYEPKFTDADGDAKPEIFGLVSASGNYKTKAPFTDQSSWLMILDENLEFEFPPVEFPGMTNMLDVAAYQNKKFRGYVVSHNTGSADTSVLKPRIMLFSLKGEKINELLYEDMGMGPNPVMKVLRSENGTRIFIMGRELIELDSELKVVNRVTSPFMQHYFTYVEDIDLDGVPEFLLYSGTEKKLVVYSNRLRKMAETSLDVAGYYVKFSHFRSANGNNKMYLNSPDSGYFIELTEKKLYYFGYLLYPGIYLLLVLFTETLNRITTARIQKRESLKQRLLTLQLQGIKTQLDPHFTFNALNSIASLIYLEDPHAAYDYLNKFTQLLRAMLNDAECIYRTLNEEINFVTTYLELEKMRFGDKLNYRIEIGKGVTGDERVPKLVMHTFAENAIKHGIMPGEKDGMLQISVIRDGEYLYISIEDNGVGREKSAGQSQSTGKGLKLTGEFYGILNQLNSRPITHSIIDLYDKSGQAAGTRVEIYVPIALETGNR